MEKETKWGVALLVLVVLFLGTVLASGILPQDLRQQHAANEATISGLRTSLERTEQKEAAEGEEETTPMTPEEEEKALASASEAGNKIAEYQNAYMTLDARTDRENFEANRDAVIANGDAMGALLSDGAKNAKVPWYQSKLPGTWSFMTDGSFSGDTLGVLWLCRDPESGVLRGYATGTYEASTGTFSNVQYRMTQEAAAPQETGGQPEKEQDVEDLAEKINEVDTSDIPDQAGSQEDRDAMFRAREQKKQQQQNQ